MNELQRCPRCESEKDQYGFHDSAWGKSGSYCRACKAALNKAAYDNKPHQKLYQRLMARAAKYDMGSRALREMCLVQKDRCACCKVTPLDGTSQPDRDELGRVTALICYPCWQVVRVAMNHCASTLPDLARYLKTRGHAAPPVRPRHANGTVIRHNAPYVTARGLGGVLGGTGVGDPT